MDIPLSQGNQMGKELCAIGFAWFVFQGFGQMVINFFGVNHWKAGSSHQYLFEHIFRTKATIFLENSLTWITMTWLSYNLFCTSYQTLWLVIFSGVVLVQEINRGEKICIGGLHSFMESEVQQQSCVKMVKFKIPILIVHRTTKVSGIRRRVNNCPLLM